MMVCVFQVVKSDTDCEGASESDTQTRLKVKIEECTPSSDVIVEECTGPNELASQYQKVSLVDSGTENIPFIFVMHRTN